MNPEPFQRLVKELKIGFLNNKEFSKAWNEEKKRQKGNKI